MIKRVNGYCPFIDDTHSIYLKIGVLRLSGNIKPQYKILGKSCEYGTENNYPYLKNHTCPLAQSYLLEDDLSQ